MNDTLENALKETWEKKDRFYEEHKDLSVLEIVMKLENRYGARGTSPNNKTVSAPVRIADRMPLKRLGAM